MAWQRQAGGVSRVRWGRYASCTVPHTVTRQVLTPVQSRVSRHSGRLTSSTVLCLIVCHSTKYSAVSTPKPLLLSISQLEDSVEGNDTVLHTYHHPDSAAGTAVLAPAPDWPVAAPTPSAPDRDGECANGSIVIMVLFVPKRELPQACHCPD